LPRFLIPLTLLLLAACSNPAPPPFERALAIERELVRTSKDLTYADSGYVQVLRELRKVPRSSADKPRAMALAQRISDGRRIALNGSMPQVDHLPDRLTGAEAPQPPTRKQRVQPNKRTSRKARPKPAALTAAKERLDLTDAQRNKLDITLYSTTWCGYCKKARRWMTSAEVPFVEKDIEKDPGANAEYQKAGRGYRGVPLIVVNGKPLRGFSRPSVEAAIRAVVGS
jgi:glutaredoxin